MSKIYGVVVGIVTQVDAGKVKVNFPWLDDNHETDWVRIATAMSGNNRGTFYMPEVADEVLCAFDQGNPRIPYVIGFLWNGKDDTPATDTRERAIRSKNGHTIRFLDSTVTNGDLGALIIQDANGNVITMSNGKITIKSTSILELSAPTITLGGQGWRRVIAPNGNPI
jgi:uncharacterized protein involved in type VI secretion and phage assembly